MAVKKSAKKAAKKAVKKNVAVKKSVKKTAKKAVKKAVVAAAVDTKKPAKKAAKKVVTSKASSTAKSAAKVAKVLTKFSPDSGIVEIAGNFNKWKPQKMKKYKDGNWTVELKLAPGAYQYKLVFDGDNWQTDQDAPIVMDADGNANNLLEVE